MKTIKQTLTGILLLCLVSFNALNATPLTPPTITSFSPSSGSVGTLVTISGTNLSSPTALTIGGITAIVISNTGTSLVAMVMPNAATGSISITTAGGTIASTGSFTVIASNFPVNQQGNKLVGTGNIGNAGYGGSVAVSSDGNTAIVSGSSDNANVGAAWIYTRSGGVWSQQGNKLVGSGAVGASIQGISVAISADGNTAIVGGYGDDSFIGASWIFTRSNGVWSQQGNKLIGTGAVGAANQGNSVSLSADGNTAVVGGDGDENAKGSFWVFVRSNGVWSQQGSKLRGTPANTAFQNNQCRSVSISADGKTIIEGGPRDLSACFGAAWIFTLSGTTWSEQAKLVGTGATSTTNTFLGQSVAISADGNTAIVGGYGDNSNLGAAWVFSRSGTTWSQQGNKLVGTGATGNSNQGIAVSISADGKTAMVGGYTDNSNLGASWIYGRTGTTWAQQGNKLVGAGFAGNGSFQGGSLRISADGNTAIVGGSVDNFRSGAAWIFSQYHTPTITAFSPTTASTSTTVTISGHYFTGATSVSFGGTDANSFTVLNDSTITAVVGSGSSGNVTVTGLGGPASLAGFNYCVLITPSVSIVENRNSVCAGTSVRITATAINGGTSPNYNFMVNGNSVKNSSSNSYTSTTFNNNDVVTCLMTANNVCQTSSTANSNIVTMIINSGTHNVTTQTACSNYLWNGQNYTSSGTYTYNYNNANGCSSVDTLKLTVTTLSTPSISIVADANNVCFGTTITFTATPVNGGTAPTYQWKKNGVNVGTNINTYSSTTLNNNDSVWCVLTSNSTCATTTTATSNKVKMIIKAIPTTPIITSGVILNCTIGSITNMASNYWNTTWSSSNPSVATVTFPGAGGTNSTYINALSNGSTTITFTVVNVANGCTNFASTNYVVAAANAGTIVAASGVCLGNTIQATNSVPGGVWSFSNNKALVNASGVLTGNSVGSGVLSYKVTNAQGCMATTTANIATYALPVAPTVSSLNASKPYCKGATYNVTASPTTGAWTTSNASTSGATGSPIIVTLGNTVGASSLTYTITDVNGCTANRVITATVGNCVGSRAAILVAEPMHQQINVYPNPAKGVVSLQVEKLVGTGTVEITDIYGKVVYSSIVNSASTTVDISHFGKGLYLVSMITNEGKVTKKLVVE